MKILVVHAVNSNEARNLTQSAKSVLRVTHFLVPFSSMNFCFADECEIQSINSPCS